MPVVKLTQNFVNNGLSCPTGKTRVEFVDQDVPGLYIEVRAASSGRGTFWYRHKVQGKLEYAIGGNSRGDQLSGRRDGGRSIIGGASHLSPDCSDGYQNWPQVSPFGVAPTLPLDGVAGGTSGRFSAKIFH